MQHHRQAQMHRLALARWKGVPFGLDPGQAHPGDTGEAVSNSAEHKALVNSALEWLAQNRYFAWPNQTGAAKVEGRFIRFGKVGSADILSVLAPDGRHAEFEAKTGNAVQRKGQKT